ALLRYSITVVSPRIGTSRWLGCHSADDRIDLNNNNSNLGPKVPPLPEAVNNSRQSAVTRKSNYTDPSFAPPHLPLLKALARRLPPRLERGARRSRLGRGAARTKCKCRCLLQSSRQRGPRR